MSLALEFAVARQAAVRLHRHSSRIVLRLRVTAPSLKRKQCSILHRAQVSVTRAGETPIALSTMMFAALLIVRRLAPQPAQPSRCQFHVTLELDAAGLAAYRHVQKVADRRAKQAAKQTERGEERTEKTFHAVASTQFHEFLFLTCHIVAGHTR